MVVVATIQQLKFRHPPKIMAQVISGFPENTKNTQPISETTG